MNERALEPLANLDAELAGTVRHTLAPGREAATSLSALGQRAIDEGMQGALLAAFVEGLAALAGAIRTHFPDNLLWDLDAVAGSLCRRALCGASAAELASQLARLRRLQELYGCHTPIRFSYIHDFVYGFDWAKWAARAPEERASIGPFDESFLQYSERRGRELLELIEEDDRKYPRLPDERPRNPFGFSRAPAAELTLHRALARDALLPVEAWRWSATPRWDRPFSTLRRQRAQALGLALP